MSDKADIFGLLRQWIERANSVETSNKDHHIKKWLRDVKALELDDPRFTGIIAAVEQGRTDEKFFSELMKHLKIIEKCLLRQMKTGSDIYVFASEEESFQYHFAGFVLAKVLPFSNPDLPFYVSYVERIKSAPPEAFMKPDKVSVQKFEENLKKGDVFFAEVIATDVVDLNVEFCLLRFISIFDDDSIVYHLNVKIHIFKKEEEVLLGRKIQLSEIFKVTMLRSICRGNNVVKHYGTVMGMKRPSAELDRLSQKKLPFDLSLFKEASEFSCYARYLNSRIHLIRDDDLIKGVRSLGLDPHHHPSFNEEHEQPNNIGAAKKAAYLSQQMESNKYLEEGNVFVLNGDIPNALAAFDKALNIWPKNYAVFAFRGQMFADFKNKEFYDLKKAVLDFGYALSINPHSESVKHEFSKIFLHTAKKLITKRKYIEAKKILKRSINLDKGNEEAIELLQKVNKKLLSSSKLLNVAMNVMKL